MSVTDEIKSRLDIVDIVGETVQLRKTGRSYSGFCPFHNNTRSPAFHVFPDTQTWYCFGQCAEGGDLFSFVMKKQGFEFKEALEYLAQRAGVKLEPNKPRDKKKEERVDRLQGLMESAADYFHQLLLYAPQAEEARQYVAGRDFNEATQTAFRFGFALNQWDAAKSHFLSQGYSQDELLAVGLLTQNEERGTVYDRFRNRLVIPIRDLQGKVVGFGARTLEKDGIPKYLNSPQSELFDKGRLLFGLDEAKRHIREAQQVVIVEGYMDVIRAWQAGFRNVVAQMGTALTSDQLRLLKRYTKRFVLALDADAAGINATMRSLDVARETLDRQPDFSFDARGLIHQEGRLQADIRVVIMPEGEDPDDVIRHDPVRWPQLLAQAKSVVEFVIDTMAAASDLADPKQKTALAKRVLPLINDIPEPVERDHYRQMLARRLDVDERSLRQMAPAGKKPAGSTPQRKTVRGTTQPTTRRSQPESMPAMRPITPRGVSTMLREEDYLRHCLTNPALVRLVDQRLLGVEQAGVAVEDFTRTEDKVLLQHLREQLERGTMTDVDGFLASVDEPLQERARLLLNKVALPPDELHYLPDRLAKSILDCRLERVRIIRSRTKELMSQAKRQQDRDGINELLLQQVELTRHEREINRGKFLLTSASQR